jgi:hypothetical protein
MTLGTTYRLALSCTTTYDIVEYRPVVTERRGKHASTTIELLLQTVFSTRFMPRSYLEDKRGDLIS